MMLTNLACCTWALSGSETEILQQIADIGFRWIDVRAIDFVDEESQEQISSFNMKTSCVGISFGLPEGASLDLDYTWRTHAIEAAKEAIFHAAVLGAKTAYVIPGEDDSPRALYNFASNISELANEAQVHGVKLCIEHFPGLALPTVAKTLDFIRNIDHPNLYLLLDIGHAKISKENIGDAILEARNDLGYVHLDDNDGVNDLHWALLDGVLTEEDLYDTFMMLGEIGYHGGISLELLPTIPNPLDAIQRSWKILQPYL